MQTWHKSYAKWFGHVDGTEQLIVKIFIHKLAHVISDLGGFKSSDADFSAPEGVLLPWHDLQILLFRCSIYCNYYRLPYL